MADDDRRASRSESDASGPTRRVTTDGGYSALASGTRLDGRYTLQNVIAAGGFGITYLAVHDSLGRFFAIKEHFPRQFAYREGTTSQVRSTDPATFSWALNRFLEEGRTLATLKHPNVVDVTDVFEANATAYMVLAYEEGQTLEAWLQGLGRRPSQEEVDSWLEPLLDALEHVHRTGLLHRDIKPSNIIIRPDGSPCLIDFGAARQAIAGRSQLTGIVTPGYSPPEQHDPSGRGQRAASDIYALAATCYRAVTGLTPPSGALRGADDDLVPVTDAASEGYRTSFLAAIDGGMRIRISERPQSIEEWRKALIGNDGLGALQSPSPPVATVVDRAPANFANLPAQQRSARRGLTGSVILIGFLAIAAMGAMAAAYIRIQGATPSEAERPQQVVTASPSPTSSQPSAGSPGQAASEPAAAANGQATKSSDGLGQAGQQPSATVEASTSPQDATSSTPDEQPSQPESPAEPIGPPVHAGPSNAPAVEPGPSIAQTKPARLVARDFTLDLIPDAQSTGEARTGRVGIRISDGDAENYTTSAPDLYGTPGVLVTGVQADGPASKAGLHALDLITAVDGAPVL
ncbi:MAG: protein kinase, partial [Proteobacteria bacterium]|nr:protein kinase [Pseudomonadota bacterium]